MFQLGKHKAKQTLARVLLACICVFQIVSAFSGVQVAAAASAPNVISYQGRVLNANGIPVTDATISMIFELYTASSGGTCVWSNSSASCATATARSVTLTDGLFSEALGDTGSSYAAIGDTIFGDNAALYLQVTVGGETLTPRKQILAAPYALNSDTLDGLDADTDGATTSAIVALNSSGNVAFTGDPTGATVSTGVMYINPAAAGADETIVGIADNGTDRFRIDKEGDVFIKGIELDGAGVDNVTSGASQIGVFDELEFSNATNLQDVLDDLDATVDGIVTGGAVSKWTDAGTFTYLTTTADDLVIGDSTVAGASFFFDESAGQLDLGTDSALGGTLRLYSVTAATADPTLAADASGNLDITTAAVEVSGDIAVNGGDFTTSAATFNLLATNATTVNAFAAATSLNINDAAVTSTIDIGGVTSDSVTTVNIATNSTSSDVVAIGNTNGSTLVSIAGGDDWQITTTGVLTLSASAAATTAIVLTDTDYTNALSIGDNDITGTTFDLIGTTSTIDFTNFDVASTGAITVAAGTGLDTNGAGALAIGNTNATSVSLCNSAACDTLSLGTNADADTITIGEVNDDVSITDAQWSISAAGTGTFTDVVCTDCLDFDAFEDSLDLDASTAIVTDGTETLTFTNGSSGNTFVDLTSTGDFAIRDNGTTFFTFSDTGTLDYSNAVIDTSPAISVSTNALTTGDVIGIQANALTTGSIIDFGTSGTFSGNLFEIEATGAATGAFINIISSSATATAEAIVIELDNGNNDNDVFVLNTDETTNSGTAADTTKARITSSGEFFSDRGFTAGGASTKYYDGSILTSSVTTFDFQDGAGASTTIDIGGVTTSLANTVNIATNSTAADTISIGNSNASSTVAITGGDDWSISSTGVGTFSTLAVSSLTLSGDLAVNGDDITSDGTLTIDSSGIIQLGTSDDFIATGDVDFTFVTGGAATENLAIDITHATDASVSGQVITLTNTAAADTGTNYLLALVNANDGGATGTPDGLLALSQNDTNEAVAAGLIFDVAAGGLTTALDVSDAQIDTALSVGANDIVGTTGLINYTNFDVASTGAITVAAGVGLDTNGAGALLLGNTNATSVSACNSAACDTLTLGTNTDADTISIGDSSDSLTLTETDWSITSAGLITTADDVAINGGDLTTSATTFNLLATNATTVNTFSAATTLNINDAAVTSTIDIGGVTTNGTNTVNIATNSSTSDIITIGNANASTEVAITSGMGWSITSGGVLTMAATSAQTTAIVLTDTDYTNALSIGDNDITGTTFDLVGTTSTIDFTNFDVASTGAITVAAGTGLDTNGAGALAIGNTNATSVSLCNSAACDTIGIGTNTDADTITIGESNDDVSITDAQWSISAAGAASFTSIAMTDDVDFTFVTDGAQSENLNITVAHGTDVSLTGMVLTMTDTAAADTGTNYLAAFVNADDAGATGTPDGLLALQTSDTNESVAVGLTFDVAAGGLLTAIDVSDAQIGSALSLGANDITGTTAAIDMTNFDVSSSGEIQVAATQGLDTNGAGALRLGQTNATSLTGCNSAACDTIAFGTTTDADTILIGDGSADSVSIGGANWTILASGLITTAEDLALNGGDLTTTASTFNLLATNATTVNAFAAATTLNFNDAAVTSTIDIGGVTSDGSNILNIATNGTSADTITIGNTNASTLMDIYGGNDWSISQSGDLIVESITGSPTAWAIDSSGNASFAGGNFTDDLIVTGGDFTSTSATFNFLDAASNSTTLDIGGVTTSLANTINIATNATAADTITIGNSNASTTVAITGGNDWSISAAGTGTFTDLACTDCLDFTELSDTLALDTTTSITTDGSETFTLANTGTGDTIINMTSTGDFEVQDNGSTVFTVQDTGYVRIGSGGGSLTGEGLMIDPADVTGISSAASALTIGIHSVGLADGTTLTNHYDAAFFSTSLSGVAAGGTETITTAATVYVAGAPSNGGNLTITNGPYAIFVDTDDVRFDGNAIIGGSTSATETLSDATFTLGGDDLFVAGTMGLEGILYTDGGVAVASGGDITCVDCLTFTDFTDSMTLDATTTVTHSTLNFVHDLTSTGDFVINDSGSALLTVNDDSTVDYTSSATAADAWDLNMNTLTSGTGIDLDVDALLTGTAFSVGSGSTTLTSGDLIGANHTATYTATTALSGNVVDLTRALTMNSGGNTLTVSGAFVNITSGMTQTAGTLTDTAVLLDLNQNYASASGHVIDISNAGTGAALKILQTNDTGSTLDANVGGSVHISDTANDDYSFTIYNNSGSSSNTALARVFNDHIGHDTNLVEIVNDSNSSTSSGLVITQNVVADATTAATSQGLAILVNAASSSAEVMLVVSDADGTPDAEFRLENDGDLFADGAAYNSGADYAEFFYTVDASLGAHHVVCQDLNNNLAVKKCDLGDPTVVGVVSTSPGFVGNNIPGADGSLEGNPNYRIVGLEGQIETYVTAADGAIAVGDPLTASSMTAGYAGKAQNAGRVIGFALEPLASGSGTIKVRVSPGWHAGDILDDNGEVNSVTSTLALEALNVATSAVPASDSQALAFRGSVWNGNAAETLTMSLSNKVTDANNYRLSVANNAGAEVAYINNLGDLVLSGKLYPSNQGAAQTSAYIYYDSNGVGYMRTNAAGWGTGSYDFAEMFPSPEVLTPGDVVVFGDGAEQVKRSTGQTYDDRIAGVVSTRPGFLAGTYRPGDSPIALSGRVPTRVSGENGPIAIGDPLTTSSTPGVAMKATQPGPIVGYAMQPFAAESGMITVFIRASYYDGDGANTPALMATPVSEVGSGGNLSSLSLNGGPITSVSSISGLGNTWSLTESGNLVTRGRLVQIVKSHQNEDVETYAAASREMTIQLSGTATLNGNTALIDFDDIDPQFNDVISTTAAYRVLATPSGVTGQIYVTDRTTNGFTIHAENGGDGVMVDWLVIAYHKDYEPQPVANQPAEEVSEPEPVIEESPEPEVAGEATEEPAQEPISDEPVNEEPAVEEVVTPAPEEPVESAPTPEEPVAEEVVTPVEPEVSL